MKLRTYLNTFTKDELIDVYRKLELSGYSKCKKAELIDHIVTYLSDEKTVRTRLTCLTKDQLSIYQKAMKQPISPSIRVANSVAHLTDQLVGCLDDYTNDFYVFDEIVQTFHSVYDDEFKYEQKRKGWLMDCIQFAIKYYGLVPVEVLHKLYKQMIDGDVFEMMHVFNEIPIDIARCGFFTFNELGASDWDKNDPLYSDIGLIISYELFEFNIVSQTLNGQGMKPFYIPSVKEINELDNYGYEINSPQYRNLKNYLAKEYDMNDFETQRLCVTIWDMNNNSYSFGEIISFLTEHVVELEDTKQADIFINYVMQAYNNTRVIYNRGCKPTELRNQSDSNVIRAGRKYSSNPDKHPETIHRRVNQDDLCPCGSGKPYDQCCGKYKS